MKLLINPVPKTPLFAANPQLVLILEPEGQVDVFYQEGSAQPDRHFVLSLAQMALFAIEENDHECVEYFDQADVSLERHGKIQTLNPELLIARSEDSKFATLIIGDASRAGKSARQAVRSLTGRIRLDVP
jgi:hypothetical protein